VHAVVDFTEDIYRLCLNLGCKVLGYHIGVTWGDAATAALAWPEENSASGNEEAVTDSQVTQQRQSTLS